MHELLIYKTTAELPPHFYYQMEAFVRIVWVDGDFFNIDLGWEEEAAHFLVASEKKLISYASVISVDLDIDGETYKCGGLGTVLTFPAFRGKGYGGQVVKAASHYILHDANFDFGLLWTGVDGFYKPYGWEIVSALEVLVGNPEQPQVYDDEVTMILWASERAKKWRDTVGQKKIYIGEETW